MIANSTNISNRIFRSQRYIILMIFSCFLVLLVITGLAGHHEKVVQHVQNFKTKASDSLYEFYSSGNRFTSDKSEYDMEKEAETEEEFENGKEKEKEKEKETNALPDSQEKAEVKKSISSVSADHVANAANVANVADAADVANALT